MRGRVTNACQHRENLMTVERLPVKNNSGRRVVGHKIDQRQDGEANNFPLIIYLFHHRVIFSFFCPWSVFQPCQVLSPAHQISLHFITLFLVRARLQRVRSRFCSARARVVNARQHSGKLEGIFKNAVLLSLLRSCAFATRTLDAYNFIVGVRVTNARQHRDF